VAWCLRGFAGDCDLAAWLTEPSASRSLRSHPDLALHELGCTQGRAWSCHLAAWKWAATGRRFDDAGAVDREAHAVGLHTRACVLGAAPSCCEGAWIRAHGAAANRDLAKARALFDRASCMLEQELGACAVLRDEPAIASPSHTVESLRTVIRGIEWPVSSVDAKVEESCRPPRPGIQRQSEDLGVNWQ
jgi:hypothetical protein